jgi:oxygen-independent coproporphyrinogen-3 oxidase
MHNCQIEFDWDRTKQYFFFYPPIAALDKIDADSIWKKEIGLYFHIPFCKTKCHYCYYVSLPDSKVNEDFIDNYMMALRLELEKYTYLLKDQNIIVTSIYFGGGTPTYIQTRYIADIIHYIKDNFSVTADAEITVDSCPITLTDEKINELTDLGVKRICMGVQTFDETILSALNRYYSGEDVIDRLKTMKKFGINYRVIDLMYGLPGQNFEKLNKDLSLVKETMPEGLSYYRLSIRPETMIYNQKKAGEIMELPNEETNIAYNEYYIDTLNSFGYKQVATPAFAIPPRDFKHQRNYWSGGTYIGMGVSSFSYFNDFVFINTRSIKEYINLLYTKNTLPLDFGKKVTLIEAFHRDLSLNIKLLEIDADYFLNKYDVDIMEHFKDELTLLLKNDLITKNGLKYFLTKKGIVYNDNISRLFYSKRIKSDLELLDKEQNIRKNLI